MPNFVSPGVYVIEKDISDYPPTINSSVVGIVGFASRGPITGVSRQKATLITSQQQLIDTFGEPSEHIKGQALEGALEILETTTSMRFIRCASDDAQSASGTVSIGGCPSVWVSGTAAAPLRPADGLDDLGMSAIGSADLGTSDVKLTVTALDSISTTIIDAKTYDIPKGTLSVSATNGATTVLGLKKVLGGALDANRIGAFADATGVNASSFVVGLAAGSGATLEISAGVKNEAGTYVPLNMFREVDQVGGWTGNAVPSVTTSGITVVNTDVAYLVKSLWEGDGYNTGTKADGTTSGVSFEVKVNGGESTMDDVNNLGVAAENVKTTMTSGSAFLETQIGVNYDARTSDYITGYVVTGTYDDVAVTALTSFEKPLSLLLPGSVTITGAHGGQTEETVNPRFVKLVQGTYNLNDGDNGIPSDQDDIDTAVVGETDADTGGKKGIEGLDDDVLNISIALAPGPGVGDSQAIQNALTTVAERTTNFIALVSPPYNTGTTGDAIDWSNGFSTMRSAAINSSYTAIYWPWLKVFQVFDGKDRWLAPEIYGARQMAYTDNVADPWFAPAGFVRGRLTKPLDVEVILNQGDRDSMYSGGNVINPMVNFPQRGIAIFGQRTAQREPTALDRINVRRMMIFIKKAILASTQRLVFEPNDRFTWSRVEQLINPMLDDIANRRGITEFKVVCDESTNTPVRIDRNEMWCKVLIKPTKTAEMVIFELNLTNQSAQLGTL